MSTTASKTYETLADELALLARNKDWAYIRSWFKYWSNEEELIDKVLLWGRFFIPEYFRDPSPDFHRELIKENMSLKNEYTACPRGFAKTTLNQLCIMFEVANGTQKFIVVIEKTFSEASEVLSAVREEFKNNPMVLTVYKDMVKADTTGKIDDKNKDAEGDLFINGVRLRGKGFDSPIRGLKTRAFRPTKIYVDDVEQDEHINNSEQRKKYENNYLAGIVPAVDIEGTIKVRGTILHKDSLLYNLITQHEGKIYRAFDRIDPENTLLWPTRWTYDRLMRKKQEMQLEGKGSSKFYKEYLNEVIDDDARTFKWEWLQRYFKPQDLKFKALTRYALIDMADSKKEGADYTGVVVVAVDMENNWYVELARRYQLNVYGKVQLIFGLWSVYGLTKIGVEQKSFEDQLRPLLKQQSEETGIFPVVTTLEHHGKTKEDRIKGALEGRFELGKIFFMTQATDNTKDLQLELYDFPNARYDDLSDSLAYAEQIAKRPLKGLTPAKREIERDIEEMKRIRMRKRVNAIL